MGLLFRPRNVVSGDFLGAVRNEERSTVAVAGYTGHGVPGAMMSMLGRDLLNHIVLENGSNTVHPSWSNWTPPSSGCSCDPKAPPEATA